MRVLTLDRTLDAASLDIVAGAEGLVCRKVNRCGEKGWRNLAWYEGSEFFGISAGKPGVADDRPAEMPPVLGFPSFLAPADLLGW